MTGYLLAKEEQDRRRAFVDYAIATVGLENLKPDCHTLSAAMRWASGQISLSELMKIREDPNCL